jgi:adenine-specific DNA-methyltransferase
VATAVRELTAQKKTAMKLKDAVLSVMQRDELKGIVEEYEIEGVDLRSREEMADALRAAKRVRVDALLEYLDEQQVKAVCELVGVSATGRRRALIERLIEVRRSATAGRGADEDAAEGGGTSSIPPAPLEQTPQAEWIEPPRVTGIPVATITRPELVWPGKYDEQGNRVIDRGVALPFQVVETIKEGRATREPGRQTDLFSAKPSGDAEWRNKLIWGDNLLVMASLLEQYAGKVDLIYIDPPFASGQDFSQKYVIDEEGMRLASVNEQADMEKAASIVEEKTYRDTWGRGLDSYLEMITPRLQLALELLAPSGSIFVHTDWHVQHYVKLLLDEVVGSENFINEIVWHYYNKMAPVSKCFPRASDRILVYAKNAGGHVFHKQEEVREEPVKQLRRKLVGGKAVNVRDENGEVQYQMRDLRRLDDVWRIPCLQPADMTENTGFRTQKPLSLLRRIIRAVTNPDALVADFFCGSGSTLVAAESMRDERGDPLPNRRWIGCDLGRFAIHMTRKRLLDIPDCKPFEILNLGQYERKYWQGVTFGGEKPAAPDQAAVAAYVQFILDLYHAQPLPGTHIHGRKGGALVHVGAVDAPVTISEINAALAEAADLGQKELHILGWEWEMGLHEPLVQQARQAHGIRLRLLNIPREVMERQAVDRGDVRFFDLAHLEAELVAGKGSRRTVKVRLADFVIPDTDLIPEEVRSKVRKWSDYIDYWAVDFDFQHDTFMNQWQAYRTRKRRLLDLESAEHEYDKPGKYEVLVKVVDIFGNDTSRLLTYEVNA